jgi:hypothetical protein
MENKSRVLDTAGYWPPSHLIDRLASRDRTFIFSHAHTCTGECGRVIVCDGLAEEQAQTGASCTIGEWTCPACELAERDAHTSGLEVASSPYAIICPDHGRVYLSSAEYERQMRLPDDRWICPRDGKVSEWDDDNYERAMDARERGRQ